MYHVPSVVETLAKTNPAPALVTVIFAPGTTAPVLSVTAPTIVAVPVDDCATSLTATRSDKRRSRWIMWDFLLEGNAIGSWRGCQSIPIGIGTNPLHR
jgi:hypothetical protein